MSEYLSSRTSKPFLSNRNNYFPCNFSQSSTPCPALVTSQHEVLQHLPDNLHKQGVCWWTGPEFHFRQFYMLNQILLPITSPHHLTSTLQSCTSESLSHMTSFQILKGSMPFSSLQCHRIILPVFINILHVTLFCDFSTCGLLSYNGSQAFRWHWDLAIWFLDYLITVSTRNYSCSSANM